MMTIVATLPPHFGTEEVGHVLEREWFADVRPTGLLEERARRLAVDVPGGEHDSCGMLRVAGHELREQLVAGHVRHAQVEQNRVVPPGARVLQRLAARGHGVDRMALALEKE